MIFLKVKYTLEKRLEILDEWNKANNGSRNEKRTKYTGDFRIKVTEELLNSGLSKHEICAKYNLNKALVLR